MPGVAWGVLSSVGLFTPPISAHAGIDDCLVSRNGGLEEASLPLVCSLLLPMHACHKEGPSFCHLFTVYLLVLCLGSYPVLALPSLPWDFQHGFAVLGQDQAVLSQEYLAV